MIPSTELSLVVLRGSLAHYQDEESFWFRSWLETRSDSDWKRVREYSANIRRVTDEIRAVETAERSVFDV